MGSQMSSYMSSMGHVLHPEHIPDVLMGLFQKKFEGITFNEFEEFQMAILDVLIDVNKALPGKHYDPPTSEEIQDCYNNYKAAVDKGKEKEVAKLLREKIRLRKLDNTTLIAGIATPPAALAAKRAVENLPQLKLIKVVPDVVFVPSMTVLALITTKLTGSMNLGASLKNLSKTFEHKHGV